MAERGFETGYRHFGVHGGGMTGEFLPGMPEASGLSQLVRLRGQGHLRQATLRLATLVSWQVETHWDSQS